MLFERTGPNLWRFRSHRLRMLLDLQYRSLCQSLRGCLRTWPAEGRFLDFGAGGNPYQSLWPVGWQRVSLDPASPQADFSRLDQLVPGESFERIVALEVFEHLADPVGTLRELALHLKSDGRLLVSVPFAARIHPCPGDYHRWTPQGLHELARAGGFEILRLEYRGSDLATVAQKLNYYFFRRARNPLQLAFGLLALPFLVPAHLALLCRRSLNSERPSEDPLGFFIEMAVLK